MLSPMYRRLSTWLGDVITEAQRTDLEEVGAGPVSWALVLAIAGAVLFAAVALLVALN